MLTIALLKSIFMDPGFFPDPLEMEYQVILKNTKFKQKYKKTDKNKKTNKNNNEKTKKNPSELEEENDYNNYNSSHSYNALYLKEEDEERYRFLCKFNTVISEGPMTFSETIQLRNDINKYIEDQPEKREADRDAILNVNKEDNSQANDLFENFKGMDLGKTNLCGTCLRWKVERSHHCRQCGRCVLKMDHHCPWLANCIGFKNYKFFCLVHLYGLIATGTIILTYWEVILNLNLNYDSKVTDIFFSIFIYMSNFGLFGFLLWLFLVNWKLVLRGQTVIENADRERFPSTKSVNIYDLGAYRNFKIVFGNNPLVWFLPFFPNYEGNGIVYETNNKSR